MGNVAPFDGPVYPVNPKGEGDPFGEPFVKSVAGIESPVDLALLCVPAPAVPDVVAECGAAGVDAAVVYAGWFAEAGTEGESLQRALVDAADDRGVTLLGPNTNGLLAPGRGLYASFVPNVGRVTRRVFAEVYEDTSHRLAPLSTAEARRAVGDLRASRLLEGFRGRPEADVGALAETVRTVGDLLVDRREIAEIGANPVLATADGALVLDVLVVLREE